MNDPIPMKDMPLGFQAAVRAGLADGSLIANSPFEGMDKDWPEHQKQEFTAALGELFGWAKSVSTSDEPPLATCIGARDVMAYTTFQLIALTSQTPNGLLTAT